MNIEGKPFAKPDVRAILVCLALFCGTLLIFSRAVNHDFMDLDDPDYVTANTHVQAGFTANTVQWALTSGDAANWHPLTWFSHVLDWRLFGKDPRGHHATNVVFHALNAVLVFLVFRRLTGAFWTSAICAALFAWHPLRVESVAWIAERKDVLSGFFGLLTLLAYARYVEKMKNNETFNIQHSTFNTQWNYWLALLFFALGLMCKPMLVTLPFLMLLLDWWPLQRFAIQRLVLEKIPFFLLSAASCAVTYLVQKKAGAVVDTITFGSRVANAVVSVVRYLGKFFRPFDLAVGYPTPLHWSVAAVAGAALLVLAITAAALWQWRRRPWLLVGWLWFAGMLVPVIGLVQVGLQAMADRYTYLPVLGLQLALLWTLRDLAMPAVFRRLKPVLVVLLLAGCAARTWNQLGVWKNPHTLHEHSLAVTRENYLAESYLGTTLENEGRHAEAAVHFQRALELKPDYLAARYRLGVAFDKLGRTNEAMAAYMEVLKVNPNYGVAHYGLGGLLLEQNRPKEAIPHFQAALKIKADYDPAYLALGAAMSRLNRPQEAIGYFEKTLAINPRNAVAHFDYANVLVDLHREPEALKRYETALGLDPDFAEARVNYGNVLRASGRLEEACAQYRRASALQPKNAGAYFGLGAALEDLNRGDEALDSYLKAAQFKPDDADAQYNVGTILLNRNQPAEAAAHFQAAVKSQPDYEAAHLGLGLAAAQLGNQSEAMDHYQRALALAPDDAMALCCMGVSLRRQDRLAEAIPYYEKALRVKPDYAEVQAELGRALFRTGHPAEAVPHLERALELRPGFPGVVDILAKARGETPVSPVGGNP
jgi:tetratricopeptide (TPR) repeat protein